MMAQASASAVAAADHLGSSQHDQDEHTMLTQDVAALGLTGVPMSVAFGGPPGLDSPGGCVAASR